MLIYRDLVVKGIDAQQLHLLTIGQVVRQQDRLVFDFLVAENAAWFEKLAGLVLVVGVEGSCI